MVTNGKKWHYLAVKSFSVWLRGITSKHDGNFYYLNCFHSYITEKNLKKHEKVCNDHDYYVEMSNENSKILKYNRGEKSMKVPFIIYVDLESQLEQIHSCHNKSWKIIHRKKNYAYAFWVFIVYIMFICLNAVALNQKQTWFLQR